MSQTPVRPVVAWVRRSPEDVLTGLRSLHSGVAIDALRCGIGLPGKEPDKYLAWAEAALVEASTDPANGERRSVEAVGHAKRAVDCLFDAYLKRDRLQIHLRPRAGFTEKHDLLKLRLGGTVLSSLTEKLIARARDSAEHEYATPGLEAAGLAVEAARAVVTTLRHASEPTWGPALAGHIQYGVGTGRGGQHVDFYGFSGPFAWIWACADGRTRLGVGTTPAVDSAEVMFCDLEAAGREFHLRVLDWWDRNTRSGNGFDEGTMRKLFSKASLDGPAEGQVT